eukprot:CAMPEP_0172637540 /NCGR_PEP_ID=MMETSP1068-20121228/209479_1 /TAXON_ID=35684 /ORGANISM="Pseudopedinella elastica, Strain CCMP716" /LENGTH=389 /DNA_ID=CAMNT_0013450225 /DNA_START=135 /DNA_END=1304 /DNA_ORIENTATION=-
MIYYDKSAWFGFRFMFQWRGSIIGSAMPYVIMWTGYCACVVAIIKMEVERRYPSIKVEVPGLDGLTFVAGFMLSMQGGIAFKRYENALSGYSSLDNTCAELTRHAAMILDVEEQNELRHELRRVMIATLLTMVIDVKTCASGGHLTALLRQEVLRRAVSEGLLTPAEKEVATKCGPKIAMRYMTSNVQHRVVQLMFAKEHSGWRDKWRNEATLQPIVNIVKTFDGHWKQMLGTATVLRNQTDMAFPMCFVQVSRILWLIALLAFPLKLAHDMGWTTVGFQFLFSLAYFMLDLIAADFGNPLGLHANAVPMDELLTLVERRSQDTLDATASQPHLSQPNERGTPTPRYDMGTIVQPIMKVRNLSDARSELRDYFAKKSPPQGQGGAEGNI